MNISKSSDPMIFLKSAQTMSWILSSFVEIFNLVI